MWTTRNEAGGWLLLLCGYLGVWRPMTLAAEVSATLGSLGMRGPAGVVGTLSARCHHGVRGCCRLGIVGWEPEGAWVCGVRAGGLRAGKRAGALLDAATGQYHAGRSSSVGNRGDRTRGGLDSLPPRIPPRALAVCAP